MQNRECFSTTSTHPQADEEKGSNATDKRPSGRRRRGPSVRNHTLLSHSKNALAALKESLLTEDTASNVSRAKPKPKSKKVADVGTPEILQSVSDAVDASSKIEENSVKAGETITTTPAKSKKPPKQGSQTTNKQATSTTADGTPVHPDGSSKLVVRRLIDKKLIRKAMAAQRREIDAVLLEAKATAAQRRKIDAVLLGAKYKRAVAVGKAIENHIHSIGEHETTEALVKSIESGELFGSKTLAEALKSSNVSQDTVVEAVQKSAIKTLKIRQSLSDSGKPIRKQRSEDRKAAAREAHDRSKSLAARRTPKTPSTPARPRKIPGENVVTGPLKQRDVKIETLVAGDLELTPIHKPQPLVPHLSYGLDRVLFNPGVYQLQDPRSRVFNFDPYLQTIMPVSDFDFKALKRYITSSRDETLLAIAKKEERKYTGSTSSMTSALGHFHFLLSQWRPVNTSILSKDFPVDFRTFTALQRSPSAIFLKWKDGVYAIDADKQFDTANILSTLGRSMEKLLTLSKEDFERYRKENSNQIPLEEREADEAYNYTTMGDFLMRSQLDAHDSRLPGTGMFDLKTRAVVSIRMDTSQYQHGMDYEIRRRHGEWESFEREYYDMIRAAFLKYSLQVRMGRMDGIFVAFHNTQRIFGFQYISLPEMDLALHGTEDTTIGDSEFKLSLELLNKVLDRATAKYPEKSLRLHFETRGTDVPFMYIFAEPMEDEQILEVQESNKAVIEDFERRVLGLEPEDSEGELSEEKRAAEWASMRAKVEENMEKDELDIEEARAFAESMIEGSEIFGSEALESEEKERLINELLESSAFSEVEDEEAMVSREGNDSDGDRVEGASAGAGGVVVDEDDVGEVDEEEEEEEEIGEEDEEDEDDQEEEYVEEHEIGQAEQELDESQSLDHVGDDDLSLDKGHTDHLPDQTGMEASESQPEAEHLLADEAPTDVVLEEPEMGGTGAQGDRKPTSTVDEDHGETNTDVDNITDSESAVREDFGDKELAPNDTPLGSESHEPAPSDESGLKTETETETLDSVSTDEGSTQGVNQNVQSTKDVLAMTLTIRNKVNNRYVDRPRDLTWRDKWTIEYALEEVADPARAWKLYQACKTRRSRALSTAKREGNNQFNNGYLDKLRKLSQKGKKWRARQDNIDAKGTVKVWDSNQTSGANGAEDAD